MKKALSGKLALLLAGATLACSLTGCMTKAVDNAAQDAGYFASNKVTFSNLSSGSFDPDEEEITVAQVEDTDDVTTASAQTETSDNDTEQGGCGSVVASGVGVTGLLIAAAGLVIKKKEQDSED